MIRELAMKSRSFRGYDASRAVTREELMALVDCARYAPSSVNRQPLKYYLAYRREQLERIQPLTGWARALPEMRLPRPGHEPTGFIVICQETEWDPDLGRYLKDVGIVAQTMLLAATEMGLGGIMIGNFSPKRVAEALELPDHIVPMLLVAIGKPDETVVLTEVREDGATNYWRGEDDVHYVPKRKLEDIII
ncbi:MAG: nitroreductase family protein [Clostridiales bacterium]|nr:nitroreductase family protein [Clostridiales bacterium]